MTEHNDLRRYELQRFAADLADRLCEEIAPISLRATEQDIAVARDATYIAEAQRIADQYGRTILAGMLGDLLTEIRRRR